jgi:hypothetical protein
MGEADHTCMACKRQVDPHINCNEIGCPADESLTFGFLCDECTMDEAIPMPSIFCPRTADTPCSDCEKKEAA